MITVGRLSKGKRCADSHENEDFDTTTASNQRLSFDSKGYGCKKILSSTFQIWFA